jgi:hypothetical protein
MAEDLAARRRIRRDLHAHEQDLAPLKDPEHQARLTNHLETVSAQDGSPPPRPRGRPRKGERAKYRQVVLYLLPETIADLDRVVDLQTYQTGHYVTRTDVIREAIHGLLQRALPPPQPP